MGINIADIKNTKLRDQILRQTFSAEPLALKTVGYEIAGPVKPVPNRIRQDKNPLMNRLEQEFQNYATTVLGAKLIPQALRFKLGNGIWFKPDFVRLWKSEGIACYEVKGPHAFRGGFENLKVAAHQYPEVRWILAWKDQGEWKQQEVLP